MNKKNKIKAIISLSICSAFLLAMVTTATYAYFKKQAYKSTAVINQTTEVSGGEMIFTATSTGDFEMYVPAVDMQKTKFSTTPIYTDNGTMTVSLLSSSDYELSTCYYDIVWVWTSEDKFMSSDVELPYTYDVDGKTYPYEFSLKIDGADGRKEEVDLSSYTYTTTDVDTRAVVIDQQVIRSASQTEATVHNWTFDLNIYNIPYSQKKLFDKQFSGYLYVTNYRCDVQNYAVYYVYDFEADTFKEVKEVPKGAEYSLNNYTCQLGGEVSYDQNKITYRNPIRNTSDLNYDYCNIYFNKALSVYLITDTVAGTKVALDHVPTSAEVSDVAFQSYNCKNGGTVSNYNSSAGTIDYPTTDICAAYFTGTLNS